MNTRAKFHWKKEQRKRKQKEEKEKRMKKKVKKVNVSVFRVIDTEVAWFRKIRYEIGLLHGTEVLEKLFAW